MVGLIYTIYELTPASDGVSYRFVVSYDTLEAAQRLLAALYKEDYSFSVYKIVTEDINEPRKTGSEEIENGKL